MPVDYEKEGAVATLTLRNGSVNPITPQMHRELYDAIVDFLGDDELRVAILTGAGERAFSAGDDIKTELPRAETPAAELLADLTPAHRRSGAGPSFSWEEDLGALERYKPIVGAVKGWCLGQGLVYLLSLTDVRVASETARFGFPEIAYGMGGAGGATRLGRQIPHAAAMAMLLTGEAIDAQEAARIHLVNEVVAPEAVLERARDWARRIAQHPPLAIRIEMEAYECGMDSSRLEAVRTASRLYSLQRLALGEDETVDTFFKGDANA
jgi:enoyl-CoA hydratase/carnithine racemase